MSDDVISSLRQMCAASLRHGSHGLVDEDACRDAIIEIQRLREQVAYEQERNVNNVTISQHEIEQLRAALTKIAAGNELRNEQRMEIAKEALK